MIPGTGTAGTGPGEPTIRTMILSSAARSTLGTMPGGTTQDTDTMIPGTTGATIATATTVADMAAHGRSGTREAVEGYGPLVEHELGRPRMGRLLHLASCPGRSELRAPRHAGRQPLALRVSLGANEVMIRAQGEGQELGLSRGVAERGAVHLAKRPG